MPLNSIQTISSLCRAIENPSSGDWLFFDLDDTLLLTGLKKYKDTPSLTEPELKSAIKMLRERNIKVIGLTARKTKNVQQTVNQLKSVGIALDEIIYAPNEKHENQECPQKGKALKEFVSAHQQDIHDGKLKRIFVFDDLLNQLEDIKKYTQDINVPVFLKHYNLPQYLPTVSDDESFPENLEDFTEAKQLNGGTRSVFHIYNPKTKQNLVLKYGAHEDAGKLEILANTAYRALGVLVPPMRIYNQIPKSLAQAMKLNNRYGMFKVCSYIDDANDLKNEERLQLIKNTARKDFVAHALLGNIDIAKEDNFIIDAQHHVFCIDAGANFIFRSKGELRKEDAMLASEIDSLRDPQINYKAHEWFSEISNDEQAKQLNEIQLKLPQVEKLVWDVSQQLKLSNELRDKFLQNLSDRVDILTTRLQHPQAHSKVDKKARAGATAAGVLTYTIKNNTPYILLSKRVRHEWWDNFGGNSIASDDTLAMTAAREVAEESNHQLNYTMRELLNSPFHDIVTGRGKNQFIYRMYLCEHDEFDLNKLNDHEHTAHLWVPLDALLKAMQEAKPIELEKQKTIAIQVDNNTIPLYPPLYAMLKQMRVSENLQHLNEGYFLKRWQTLSYADHKGDSIENNAYRPMITPQQKRSEITLNMLKKAALLRELKCNIKTKSKRKRHTSDLTQSEVHLKALLGNRYQDDKLEENVRCFVEEHYTLSKDQQNELIRHCVELIQHEQENSDKFYFYHACNNEVAFAYDIYTRLYSELQIQNNWPAFRADNDHFTRFNNIAAFIAFYSKDGMSEINNNEKYYNDCALSANAFLFGNHKSPTSSSIHYMLSNDVNRNISLESLFINLFKPFDVTDQEIKELVSLYNQYAAQQGGVLYQIGMSKEDARRMSYAAGSKGKLSPFQNSYDLPEIVDKFKSDAKLIVDQQEYLSKLQARVMLPPQLQLEAYAVSLDPLPEQIKNRYQAALKRMIDALAFQILNHYSSENATYAQGKLTKNMPSLLQANQLVCADSPQAVLLSAVNANNINLVKDILQKFPALLNQKIYNNQLEYISTYDSYRKKQNALTVMEYIIKHSSLPLDDILDFTQDAWLDTFSHINSYQTLVEMMQRLPKLQHLKFLSKHSHIISENFLGALELLEQKQRLPLATACINYIKYAQKVNNVADLLLPDERVLFVKENVCSADDLIYLLKRLPEEASLLLVQEHIKLISQMDKLIEVIACLPYKMRFNSANVLLHKIKGYRDIAGILNLLPDEKKLLFAQDHSEDITDGKVLAQVLALLPQDQRLAFAKTQQHKIECSCSSLPEIIGLLNLNDRYDFALKNARSLSIDSFPDVLLTLKPENRLEFSLLNWQWLDHLLNNESEKFKAILQALPEKDRIPFVKQYPWDFNQSALEAMSQLISNSDLRSLMLNRITNATTLIFTLPLCPDDERLNLVLQHKDLINGIFELEKVVALLPRDQRSSFALEFKHLISSDENIVNIAKLLDENNRPSFTFSCTQNFSTMLAVLKHIPITQRLQFVKQYQKNIQAEQPLNITKNLQIDLSNYFYPLLELFKDSTSVLVAFASLFLRDGYQLVATLSLLPESDRLDFATKHQDLIKSYICLDEIVKLLPETCRFTFATTLQDIIKPGDCFSDLLRHLNPSESISFAQANRHKILSSFTLSSIQKILPENARMDFIKSCANNGDTLVYILRQLENKDILPFAIMHQNLVTDNVLANEGRCQGNHHIDRVADLLPEQQRLPYLLRNLKDGFGVAAIMKQLTSKEEIISFAYQYQKLIGTGKQLCAVVERLPAQAREPFLAKNGNKLIQFDCLLKLLGHIKPQNQLSFLSAHQEMIRNDWQLVDILSNLIRKNSYNISADDVFDFIRNNLLRLTNSKKEISQEVYMQLVKRLSQFDNFPNNYSNGLSFFRCKNRWKERFYAELLKHAEMLPTEKQSHKPRTSL